MAARIESSESSGVDQHSIPLRLQFAWRVGRRVWLAIKAIGGLALFVLSSLAEQYNVVDLQELVRSLFANSTRLSLIVVCVTVGWVTLQALLKMPKGRTGKANQDDGE